MKTIWKIQICILKISFICILTGCGTSIVQLTENERIKEKITKIVAEYSSDNWEKRRKAVREASKYSNSIYAKNIIIFLILASKDSHHLVRIETANKLGEICAIQAMPRLQEMSSYDPKNNVRWRSLIALGNYENSENEKIFNTGITNKDWLIREASIKGLLKIKDTKIKRRNMPSIKKALQDNSIAVRITALKNLKIKNTELYQIISSILKNKQSGISLKKAALTAIKGYKFDKETRQIIQSLLTHRNSKIRVLALRALKEEEIVKKE